MKSGITHLYNHGTRSLRYIMSVSNIIITCNQGISSGYKEAKNKRNIISVCSLRCTVLSLLNAL